jgi:periplasmic divalent cation tolerance protein
MTQTRAFVALVTTPVEDARSIAIALVEGELAACVNIVPLVQSVYHWKGKIESDEEALLIVKTTEAAMPALTKRLDEIHPYDTFELISLEIDDGSRPYLDWILESVPRRS